MDVNKYEGIKKEAYVQFMGCVAFFGLTHLEDVFEMFVKRFEKINITVDAKTLGKFVMLAVLKLSICDDEREGFDAYDEIVYEMFEKFFAIISKDMPKTVEEN